MGCSEEPGRGKPFDNRQAASVKGGLLPKIMYKCPAFGGPEAYCSTGVETSAAALKVAGWIRSYDSML